MVEPVRDKKCDSISTYPTAKADFPSVPLIPRSTFGSNPSASSLNTSLSGRQFASVKISSIRIDATANQIKQDLFTRPAIRRADMNMDIPTRQFYARWESRTVLTQNLGRQAQSAQPPLEFLGDFLDRLHPGRAPWQSGSED
jgi:hypothetical protein